MARDHAQAQLYRESGRVRDADPVVMLFYLLGRHHLPFGVLWNLVDQVRAELAADPTYTNGYMAQFAQVLTQRLRGERR